MMVRQRFLILLLGLAYSVMLRGFVDDSFKLDLGLSEGDGRAFVIVVVSIVEVGASGVGRGLADI